MRAFFLTAGCVAIAIGVACVIAVSSPFIVAIGVFDIAAGTLNLVLWGLEP